MLDAVPTSNELKEKRLMKKAKHLSEDFNQKNKEPGSSAPQRTGFSSSGETESGSSRNLHQIQGSFGMVEEQDRRSSSPSDGYSFLTAENPSMSSAVDSQASTLSTLTTKHIHKGKPSKSNRHEDRPPSASATRRQSLDGTSRSASLQKLKRSTSLWVQRHERQGDLEDAAAGEFQERYIRNFGTGTMSERQRTLNVKRARKMAQLFGQDPPTELIQIHDERESGRFRDSTATLSTFLTVTPPLRDRADSISSTGTIANEGEVEEHNQVPETPPPFSTTHAIDDPTQRAVLRRRTAKLSRFFGVGLQDISLPAETAPALPETRIDVDVKVSGRRFWSFGDRSKDGDMQEAIQKLRGLKVG